MAALDALGMDPGQMMQQQLATLDSSSSSSSGANNQLETLEGSRKRKTRFAESFVGVKKKKGRWGAPDDKPYKPQPFIDLPMGLTSTEVDQFLREQRLDELSDKIRDKQLERPDRDIRPPSPPPVYD